MEEKMEEEEEEFAENGDVDAILDKSQKLADEAEQENKPVSLSELRRQITVWTIRMDEINNHAMVREENLRKSISELTTQNTYLRAHLKALDQFIKKLSLVHSQLTAAPNYKLAKADVEEMIRLVSSL